MVVPGRAPDVVVPGCAPEVVGEPDLPAVVGPRPVLVVVSPRPVVAPPVEGPCEPPPGAADLAAGAGALAGAAGLDGFFSWACAIHIANKRLVSAPIKALRYLEPETRENLMPFIVFPLLTAGRRLPPDLLDVGNLAAGKDHLCAFVVISLLVLKPDDFLRLA